LEQPIPQPQLLLSEYQLLLIENTPLALEEQVVPNSQLPDWDGISEEETLVQGKIEREIIWRNLRQLCKLIRGRGYGNVMGYAANQGINVEDVRLMLFLWSDNENDSDLNYLHQITYWVAIRLCSGCLPMKFQCLTLYTTRHFIVLCH
jgi:hypothetical protein